MSKPGKWYKPTCVDCSAPLKSNGPNTPKRCLACYKAARKVPDKLCKDCGVVLCNQRAVRCWTCYVADVRPGSKEPPTINKRLMEKWI